MFRRAVVDVFLVLLALMLAGSPLLAAERELMPRLREDLDRARVAMRHTSQERLELLAQLAGERAAEALRYGNEGSDSMARWALAWTVRLMEMTQLEARRGIERGEDLGEALGAVERACVRAEESLRRLLERGPGHVDAVQAGLQAVERSRETALEVLGQIAAGEQPGRAGSQPDRTGGAGTGPPAGPAGR